MLTFTERTVGSAYCTVSFVSFIIGMRGAGRSHVRLQIDQNRVEEGGNVALIDVRFSAGKVDEAY